VKFTCLFSKKKRQVVARERNELDPSHLKCQHENSLLPKASLNKKLKENPHNKHQKQPWPKQSPLPPPTWILPPSLCRQIREQLDNPPLSAPQHPANRCSWRQKRKSPEVEEVHLGAEAVPLEEEEEVIIQGATQTGQTSLTNLKTLQEKGVALKETVTACDCKCYFDGPHNGGVYPPHHWHSDHVCTPKSWDHTVREEEKHVQRRHEYNKKKHKQEEAFQTYINGSWPSLSDLDLAELGLSSYRGPPTDSYD
jgi:hypothetical protein